MNKIIQPQQITYQQLQQNNQELRVLFSNYLQYNELELLEQQHFFKYTTKLFKRFYNQYKLFFEKNKINLPKYLQRKKTQLLKFNRKLTNQPDLLIEYIIPNYLLFLEYTDFLNSIDMTNHNSTTTISF